MIARSFDFPRRFIARTATSLLALGLIFAGTALADTRQIDDDIPRAYVNYGDLDLSTEQGAVTLYKRIANAARLVCPTPTPRNMKMKRIADQCIEDAVSRAVADVNSPQLARVGAANGYRDSRG
jgi:UrcA family protein